MRRKSLNIKDPEAYRLARAVAQKTGESLTRAVVNSLQERLNRLPPRPGGRDLVQEMKVISARICSLPVLDERSDDQILGYSDRGLLE